MIRAFLIWLLCLGYDLHDTGTSRTGICKRCHLPIGEDGCAL